IVESLHVTIVHLLEQREPSNSSLLIVEQWKRKANDFSIHSNDSLFSICLKAFDVMSRILESAHYSHIKLALDILKSEYSNCLHLENTSELSIRLVMFGIIESLHLTFVHLMEKRVEMMTSKELSKRANEINNLAQPLLAQSDADPFDVSHSVRFHNIANSSALIQIGQIENPFNNLYSNPDRGVIEDVSMNEDTIPYYEMDQRWESFENHHSTPNDNQRTETMWGDEEWINDDM
ncbi:hypothetical protein PMAYCL1PPCAC_13978, partial [Pristionchus mayeri]